MTISTTTSRWEAVGNGSTTVFPYNNKIFADTDLNVYLNGVLQTLTTHYTVSGAGTDAGGNVTFLTAPANGVSVVIVRNVANTQLIDYPAAGAFPSVATEDGLDRRTIISQQSEGKISRAIQYLESDANLPSGVLPTLDSLKGRYLRFNSSTGAPEAGVFDSGLASRTVAQLTGDGTTQVFTLPVGAGVSGTNVEVYVSGVHQAAGTYTIVGTILTFTEAPPAPPTGVATNIEVILTETVPLGETDAALVSYTPSGSGATTRTVAAKLHDFVTLEDFGGGVAVADNAAAFQAAMNAGGQLYVPEGNVYNIKAAITRSGGCHIWGGGILRWTSDATSTGLTVTLGLDEAQAFYADIGNVQFQTEKAGSGTAVTINGTATIASRRSLVRARFNDTVFRGAGSASQNGWQHNIVLTGITNCEVVGVYIQGYSFSTTPEPTYAGDGIRADDVGAGAVLNMTHCGFYFLNRGVYFDGYEGVNISQTNFVGGSFGVVSANTNVGAFPHVAITSSHMNILRDCIKLEDTNAVFISGNLLWQGQNTATAGTSIRLTNCNDAVISNNILRGGRALVDYYGILLAGTTSNVQIVDNLAIDCIYLAWAQVGTDKIFARNNRTKRENANAYFSSWGVLYANTSGGNEVIFDGDSHAAAFEGLSTGVTGALRRGNRFTFGGDYEPTLGQLGHPAPNKGNSWQNALQVTRGTDVAPDTTALYARTAAYVEMHTNKVHSADQSSWGNPFKTPALTVETIAHDLFEGEANGGAFRAYSTDEPASATASKRNLVGISAVGQTNTGSGNDAWSVWGANFVAAQTSGNAPNNCIGIEVDVVHITDATAATGPSVGNNFTGYWAQADGNSVFSTAAFFASRSSRSSGWNYILYSTTASRNWMVYLENPSTAAAASGIFVQTASSSATALRASTEDYNTTSGNGPNIIIARSQNSGVAQTNFAVTSNASNPVQVRVGGALKVLEVGAADSAGTGYRTVRVLN